MSISEKTKLTPADLRAEIETITKKYKAELKYKRALLRVLESENDGGPANFDGEGDQHNEPV